MLAEPSVTPAVATPMRMWMTISSGIVPAEHVDREERRGEVDREVPGRKEQDEPPEIELAKRLAQRLAEGPARYRRRHRGLRRDGEEIKPAEADRRAETEQDCVAPVQIVQHPAFPAVDGEGRGEAQHHAERRRQEQAIAEIAPETVLRHEVTHPGIPRAARHRRARVVDDEAGGEHGHAERRRRHPWDQHRHQQGEPPHDVREDDDCLAHTDALDQQHGRHLQEVGEERDRRQHADHRVVRAERQRVANEEGARGEGPHRLAAQAVAGRGAEATLDLLLG